MDREGSKAQRANSIRALLRDLSTKLKIAFQIVDRISIAINKLRDEELWPQMKELNNRYVIISILHHHHLNFISLYFLSFNFRSTKLFFNWLDYS